MIAVDNSARLSKALANDPATASPSGGPNIDFQNFLNLLTAQLRHQDPLSPLDSTQFVTQLSSFSTVEQLVNANSKLDAIADKLAADDLQSYGAWIGRKAEISGAAALDGSPTEFRITPLSGVDFVELVVRDRSGKEIERIKIDNSNSIQNWNGVGSQTGGVSGPYFLTAEYIKDSTPTASANVTTFSRIEEITASSGEFSVRLANGAEVPAEKVLGLSL